MAFSLRTDPICKWCYVIARPCQVRPESPCSLLPSSHNAGPSPCTTYYLSTGWQLLSGAHSTKDDTVTFIVFPKISLGCFVAWHPPSEKWCYVIARPCQLDQSLLAPCDQTVIMLGHSHVLLINFQHYENCYLGLISQRAYELIIELMWKLSLLRLWF